VGFVVIPTKIENLHRGLHHIAYRSAVPIHLHGATHLRIIGIYIGLFCTKV
jgi:hypothetical protein